MRPDSADYTPGALAALRINSDKDLLPLLMLLDLRVALLCKTQQSTAKSAAKIRAALPCPTARHTEMETATRGSFAIAFMRVRDIPTRFAISTISFPP
jgi:hypothetical protein